MADGPGLATTTTIYESNGMSDLRVAWCDSQVLC